MGYCLCATFRTGPDCTHHMTSSGDGLLLAGTHQVALHAGTVKRHLLTLVFGKQANPSIDESAADVVVTEAGGHEQRRHQLLVFGLSTNHASHYYKSLINGNTWAT